MSAQPDVQDTLHSLSQIARLRKVDLTASGLLVSVRHLDGSPAVDSFTVQDGSVDAVTEVLMDAIVVTLQVKLEMARMHVRQIEKAIGDRI